MHITSASIILTEDCNLRCSYCYENKNRNCGKAMNIDTAKATVDFLIKEAVAANKDNISITFFGGEPLLNLSVLEQTFDYAVVETKKHKLKFGAHTISNATIFNDEYKEFLKKYFLTEGVGSSIQLSIDGIPKIQDSQRFLQGGGGSSHLVENTVKKYLEFFKENNLSITGKLSIHSLISIDSLPYLYENYRYFRDMGFEGVWFMPIHESDWNKEHVELFSEQLNRIANEIYEECVKRGSLEPYQAYKSLSKNASEHPFKPCAAGSNFASVDADGKLYPCHQFAFEDKDSCFGSIYDGVTDPDNRQIFLDYTTANLIGDVMCSEKCDNYSCYRCVAQNKKHNGNILIGFPKYCKMSRAENAIRKSLANRLSSATLLAPSSKKSNSCSNGGCNDTEEFVKLMTPILANLDEHLSEIKESIKSNSHAIKALDEKVTVLFDVVTQVLLSMASANKEMEVTDNEGSNKI